MKLRQITEAETILREVYASERVGEAVQEKELREQLREQLREDATNLRQRKVLVPPTAEERIAARGITLITGLHGEEAIINHFTGATTYRDLYRCVRELCGIPLRATSISVSIQYMGHRRLPNQKSPPFCQNQIVPCGDGVCKAALRGTVLQVIKHGGPSDQSITIDDPGEQGMSLAELRKLGFLPS